MEQISDFIDEHYREMLIFHKYTIINAQSSSPLSCRTPTGSTIWKRNVGWDPIIIIHKTNYDFEFAWIS